MAKLHSEKRIKAVNKINAAGDSQGNPAHYDEDSIVYDLASSSFQKKVGAIGGGSWDPIGGGGGASILGDLTDVNPGADPADNDKYLRFAAKVNAFKEYTVVASTMRITFNDAPAGLSGVSGNAKNIVIDQTGSGAPSVVWTDPNLTITLDPGGATDLEDVRVAVQSSAAFTATMPVGNGAEIISGGILTNQAFAGGSDAVWSAQNVASGGTDWSVTQNGNPIIHSANYTNTTYSNFTGDSGSGGNPGLVPGPASGDAAAHKFLKSDSTWQAVTSAALAGTMTGHIIPDLDNGYDIGSASYKIRDMYVSDNSLWVGDTHKISVSGGKMKFRKRKTSSAPAQILAYMDSGPDDNTRYADAAALLIGVCKMLNAAPYNADPQYATDGSVTWAQISLHHLVDFANKPRADVGAPDPGGLGQSNIQPHDIFRPGTVSDWDEDFASDSANWAEITNKPTIPSLLQDLQDVPTPGGGDDAKFLRYNALQNGYADVDMTGNGDVLRFTVHSSSGLSGTGTNGVVVTFDNSGHGALAGNWVATPPGKFTIIYGSNATTLQNVIDLMANDEVTCILQSGVATNVIEPSHVDLLSGNNFPTANHTIAGWSAQNTVAAEMVGASSGAPGQSGSVPAPAAGEQNMFLKANKSWADVPSSPINLNEVTDVIINDVAANQVLSYDTGTSKWVNAAPGGGGGGNSITQGNSGVSVTDGGSDGRIVFNTENTDRWEITSSGHILPMVHATGNSPYPGFDISSAEKKVRHLFLSDNSLWIGDQHKISISDDGKMKFKKRKKQAGYFPEGLNRASAKPGIATEAQAVKMLLDHNGGVEASISGKTSQHMRIADWLRYANLAQGYAFKDADDAADSTTQNNAFADTGGPRNIAAGQWTIADIFPDDIPEQQPNDWEQENASDEIGQPLSGAWDKDITSEPKDIDGELGGANSGIFIVDGGVLENLRCAFNAVQKQGATGVYEFYNKNPGQEWNFIKTNGTLKDYTGGITVTDGGAVIVDPNKFLKLWYNGTDWRYIIRTI